MTTTRTQHYPKSTVEASAWCNKCHAMTIHAVMGGKLAYCEECQKKQEQEAENREPKPPKTEQGRLF